MGDVLRLFVAAYPPASLAEELVGLVKHPYGDTARITPAEQVHLTLQFIGDTDRRDLLGVTESIKRSAAGLAPANVGVARLITLPERGPARLIAAELEQHPTLTEVHDRLALRLARNQKARRHEHFRPHLTLARLSAVAQRPAELPRVPAGPSLRFDVTEVVLVRSVLRPDRAEHRILERVPLNG